MYATCCRQLDSLSYRIGPVPLESLNQLLAVIDVVADEVTDPDRLHLASPSLGSSLAWLSVDLRLRTMTGQRPASAGSGPSAASTITEKNHLDLCLAKWSLGKPTSFLEAAVRDAGAAVDASPPALCLGTLGCRASPSPTTKSSSSASPTAESPRPGESSTSSRI
jgi:hypothetical protein